MDIHEKSATCFPISFNIFFVPISTFLDLSLISVSENCLNHFSWAQYQIVSIRVCKEQTNQSKASGQPYYFFTS